MLKRFIWKENDLLNLKLRDDLYTIAQLKYSPIIQFYDIKNSTGEWKDVDLNQVNLLCRLLILDIKPLIESKIKSKTVKYDSREYPSYWIKPYTILEEDHYKGDKDSFVFLGGRMIDLDIVIPDDHCYMGQARRNDTTRAKVLKHDLALPKDRELIEKLETTPFWLKEDLGDRLRRYFDTGINRDDLKFLMFPGLWDDYGDEEGKVRETTRMGNKPYL